MRIDVVNYLPTLEGRSYDERPLDNIEMIVVHHTVTAGGSPWDISASALTDGFLGCPYHVLIDKDGTRWKCNFDRTISWHTSGYNTRSIGIGVIGNFDYTEMTEPAKFSLLKELKLYGNAYRIDSENVKGHRELSATSCPGKHVDMNDIRAAYRFVR